MTPKTTRKIYDPLVDEYGPQTESSILLAVATDTTRSVSEVAKSLPR